MKRSKRAMQQVNHRLRERERHLPIPFEEFLDMLTSNPSAVIRNVFQLFHDMVKLYVGEGIEESPDDPENIGFMDYDFSRLLVEDADHPFFADRIFSNRLINLVQSFRRGAQQNKIYIFHGPPGCGKSTFLNNLLTKFEEYANTKEGLRWETVWRLDRKLLGVSYRTEPHPLFDKLSKVIDAYQVDQNESHKGDEDSVLEQSLPDFSEDDIVEISCPSHDHPLLMIPRDIRRVFLNELITDSQFLSAKEYDWIFKDNPCTICSSIFEALLTKMESPGDVFQMIFARPYQINRRLGEGVSVFNPGDKPMQQNYLTNPHLQRSLNGLFKDSSKVKYIFSQYAKTNDGIYALMDIKSHNTGRLIELHNIISEGVHKIEDIEESVDSLFVGVMNPEDEKEIKDIRSLLGRIEYIKIPYVMDFTTEVEIYRNIFGKHIDSDFLPRVLDNFARVIISSRLDIKSKALLEWIGDPKKYDAYCDSNLQLLKMELYAGYVPTWLSEENRKSLTAKRRRQILSEADTEGCKGFSGRESIKIFNSFYSRYAQEDKLINMNALVHYFTETRKDLSKSIPDGFLNALVHMYDYTVLQEVKESLYYYNEEKISKDIQNYLFALNYEIGAVETCEFTGEQLEITEEFLQGIEGRLLGTEVDKDARFSFRKDTQKEYTSKTLTQEIMIDGCALSETELFHSLQERYLYYVNERVLDPFLKNENFRRAIKDYDEEDFGTYGKRIREEVTYMLKNLCKKYHYTQQGAKEVCMYVIDNNLAEKFVSP
jgi:predicted Ser/Thr protein kinase